MITVIDTIGSPRRRHVYRDLRVERKGFLSIFSYELDGMRRRLDGMRRTTDAVVVLPVDFARREIYALRESRPLKALSQGTAGGEWLDGGFKGTPDEAFEIEAEAALIYELPAGMIDRGGDGSLEPPLEAAVRELREETGLEVAPERLRALPPCFPSIGGSTERVHAFIAELPDPIVRAAASGDGGEQIEILRMGWDDAFDLLAKGGFESANSGILLRELKIIDLEGRK